MKQFLGGGGGGGEGGAWSKEVLFINLRISRVCVARREGIF